MTEQRGTLGTFAGVFTPSILTILGIILFLRLGFVVGDAGLRNALIIIGIATAVSALTSISLAAIATNIEVRGGGDYYLISRTLGVEFGGAIGIVLFLAQSVSVAFYAIGFGEAVTGMAGWEASWGAQAIAAAAVLGLFGFAWAGADVASRFQFVVMALLGAALVSFFAGALGSFSGSAASSLMSPSGDGLGFWAVFAIFFPAVTGFTQGVSMSGDLRSPGRSLPLGTFAAVGISTVVYIAAAVLLAGTAGREVLTGDARAMATVAAVGPLIDVGVIAATLSSAMASFLGAPRILQSLASDRVFPMLRVFAAGHGPTRNPRLGVLLSLAIALATIALGSLDVIAPVVSMFFLISYGLLNYATYYEAHASSPSFRPRFRFFHQRASLAGALLCLGAMLAINPTAGAGAALVMYVIYQYLGRREQVERWSDVSRAHFFQRAKESIRAMTGEVEHPRNWRPQLLAFSADPERRARLLTFATWLEGGSGLTAVAQIVPGEGLIARRDRDRAHQELEEQIDDLDLDVHAVTVLAPDPLGALVVVVQSFGIGPMRANTAIFGFPEDADASRLEAYGSAVRSVARLGVGVISVSSRRPQWEALDEIPAGKRVVDVWWKDDDSGRLALLMGYLTTRTREWGRARLRVLAPVEGGTDEDAFAAEVRARLDEARIPASVVIVPDPDPERVVAASAGSGIVLFPMQLRENRLHEDVAGAELAGLLDRLPLAAGVMAGGPIDLTAGPESGPHSELLAAEQRADDAAERLRRLERQDDRLDAELSRLRAAAAQWPQYQSDIAAAEKRRAALARRIVKARARLETARAEVAQWHDRLR
jgi:amino acid transporter/chaperonin cofactor prefoldin